MFKTLISVVVTMNTLLRCAEALPLNSTSSTSRASLRKGTTTPLSCQPKTTKELTLQLQTYGSFNKRYQAITKADAAKFPNLLKQPAFNIKKYRGKRQTSPYPTTNLTSVATRGSLDQNGLRRLCTEWSAVTTLSPDYFPRYLNEIICDTKDSSCLSYKGVCSQGSLYVDVLRNTGICGSDGKDNWKVVGQWIRSCCNCRLF